MEKYRSKLKKVKYTISETNIQYSDIHNMNEAFLTSTAIGVMPCYWDGWKSDYSLTLTLKNHYNKMVKIK